MTFPEIWKIIVDAGPLALAAVFGIMWFLERSRANDERRINEDRTAKFYELMTTTQVAISQFSNTMDKAMDMIRGHRP